MRVTTTVDYDDISATFSANMTEADYGVPGSPVWWEPEDIILEEVEILGVCFLGKKELDTLPSKLVEALYEMADEAEEWER